MLDLHWKVGEYPADDPPPGGALGFELLKDGRGRQFVRAFYQAQTMDQLRNLTPLTLKAPPARVYLPIPGCTRQARELCAEAKFRSIVQAKLDHPAP
jgi:4-phytase/acid phosphatase